MKKFTILSFLLFCVIILPAKGFQADSVNAESIDLSDGNLAESKVSYMVAAKQQNIDYSKGLSFPGNINVLLLSPDNVSWEPLRAALDNYSFLTVSSFPKSGLPSISLDDLMVYDVVFIFNNNQWLGAGGVSPEVVGDLLADYIDAGGLIVENSYVMDFLSSPWAVGGRYASEAYSAFTSATTDVHGSFSMGSVLAPGHRILTDVNTISTGQTTIQDNQIAEGAQGIVQWADGNIMVATRKEVVSVNLLAIANGNLSASGDIITLYSNAIVNLYLNLANASAPAAPENFTVQPGDAGENSAQLSWTNPSTTFDASPLTELSSVKIYRDEELLTTIDNPQIGSASSYTDTDISSSGHFIYKVVAENSFGESPGALAASFIGLDIPDAPQNAELASESNDGFLSWDAPHTGVNGGYISVSDLTYTIVRFPDQVQVATDISTTYLIDDGIEDLGFYHYEITASNSQGTGPAGTSPVVLLGGSFSGVDVGEGEVEPPFRAPFDFWFNGSMAQTIYYPDELGGTTGALMGVVYYNTFNNDLPNEEIRIYAGITSSSNFSGGFLQGDIFTKVFEGVVHFPQGKNAVVIFFDQPFNYTGGNLVLMTSKNYYPYNGSGVDRFFCTRTSDRPARMRTVTTSSAPGIDPLNPPSGGSNRDWVPNTTLLFSSGGMGSLSGTVTDPYSVPVEGAQLSIDGTAITTWSDSNGSFSFPYLDQGSHVITASAIGFADVSESFEIVEDETTILSVVMPPVGTLSVSGWVFSSDNPSEGLQGAVVSLTGYNDYQVITGPDGSFVIDNVFSDKSYIIDVAAQGHLGFTAEVITDEADVVLDDIILQATDIVQVQIGEGTKNLLMPFAFTHNNSLAQTIYYSHEIGHDNGVITALQYTSTFDNPLNDRFIQIFLAETQLTDLTDGWIEPESFQLVYEGTVDFPQGIHDIFIELDEYFIYNGGNLVVYTHKADHQGSQNKRFFGSEDPGSNRSRRTQSFYSFDPLDPQQLSTVNSDYPNVTMFISTGGKGILEGTVTDGTQPLAGVEVKVLGTNLITYTNHAGNYEFPLVLSGTWDASFSITGYHEVIAEDILVQDNQTTVADVSLTALGQHNISGVVKGNDGYFIQDALVSLSGYNQYGVYTSGDGSFMLQDIFAQNYTLTVSAPGYLTHVVDPFIIDGDTDLGEIILTEDIVTPFSLAIDLEGQAADQALLTWNNIAEFRYDDGIAVNQLGFDGTLNSVMGSAHHNNAILHHVSWYLTEEGGPHQTVKLWILGLDENGNPDRYNVLYTQEDVSNTDNQWNTHELPEPVIATNGFFIGLSYDGFLGLAVDNGIGEPWEFVPGNQFGIFNIQNESSEFAQIEDWGFQVNYLIRAEGIDFGELEFENSVSTTHPISELISVPLDKPVDTGSPAYYNTMQSQKSRIFNGFNIFLNDMATPLESGLDPTSYLFTDLDAGEYVAGVQSVYTTGASEIVTIDFQIGVSAEVTVEVSTNSGDSPIGAQIELSSQDDYYQHTAVAGQDGIVVITGVRHGVYTLSVSLEGFHDYINEEIDVQQDINIPIVLTEITNAPQALQVHWDDLDEGQVLFSWEHENGWFTGFNVFLDDMENPVASGISDTEYLFTGLAQGQYTAGVQAVYSTGVSELTTLAFDYQTGQPEVFQVTFQVDLQFHEYFDQATDIVYITGEMTGWADPGEDHDNQVMVQSDHNPMIYTITYMLTEGTWKYKYALNNWDGAEWTGEPNREISVDSDLVVTNLFGFLDDQPPVNVKPVESAQILLFPNPASNLINVQSDITIHEIRLVNMLGQTVYNTDVSSLNHQIAAGSIREGFYFVHILTSKGLTVHRIQIIK